MRTPSLRDRAYRHIQAKILSGEFAAGLRVSEQLLAEEIGISRTPVRSAIRQLESEGLLEQVPRFGTIVKKLDRRDIAELYDMRIALEGFAAEAAGKGMSAEDCDQLHSLCAEAETLFAEANANERNDDPDLIARFVDADRRFHLVILRATGNRRLMKSVSDSRMLSHWCRYARTHYDVELLMSAWQQHREILEAIVRGDAFASWKAMSDHIYSAKDVALRIYDRRQAEGDAEELFQWGAPA